MCRVQPYKTQMCRRRQSQNSLYRHSSRVPLREINLLRNVRREANAAAQTSPAVMTETLEEIIGIEETIATTVIIAARITEAVTDLLTVTTERTETTVVLSRDSAETKADVLVETAQGQAETAVSAAEMAQADLLIKTQTRTSAAAVQETDLKSRAAARAVLPRKHPVRTWRSIERKKNAALVRRRINAPKKTISMRKKRT